MKVPWMIELRDRIFHEEKRESNIHLGWDTSRIIEELVTEPKNTMIWLLGTGCAHQIETDYRIGYSQRRDHYSTSILKWMNCP